MLTVASPSSSDVMLRERLRRDQGVCRAFTSLGPRTSQGNGRAIICVDAFAEIVENLGKRRGDAAECQDKFADSPIA